MKTSITIAIVAIAAALSATGLVTTLGAIQIAHAAPQEPHGTCGVGDGGEGAFGCAGNVGGFIVTPQGRCIEQGTPFSVFGGAC
jgi:hypothetical protein